VTKTEVKETTAYESLVDVKDKNYAPPSLGSLFDEDTTPKPEGKEWEKHWVGMPEFVQKEKKPFKTIYVHFRCQEDYDAFAKIIGQNLTEKTKSIWHPHLDRDANALKRWIEEQE